MINVRRKIVTLTPTITATVFEATCLDILDRLASHQLERVTITKHGKVVGVLSPPPPPPAAGGIYGCMKGTFWIDPELDLPEPIIDWIDETHSQLPE